MSGIDFVQVQQFLLMYLLLIVVMGILKKAKIDKTKLLVIASIKMTVQLILAGLILTYIFKNPYPGFTVLYICGMLAFAIHRVISLNKDLNKKFKLIIAFSMIFCSLTIITFFICLAVGKSIFNPQYTIPIGGMVVGNTMTGLTLGIKTFRELLAGKQARIQALLSFGISPNVVLKPFAKQALETAMLPTLNNMIGMGIISLPGMMTGQILAGTMPLTAILYQIAIMIAICTVVTSGCFMALFLGYRTLYDKKTQVLA